jgi:hypothetical protein
MIRQVRMRGTLEGLRRHTSRHMGLRLNTLDVNYGLLYPMAPYRLRLRMTGQLELAA